MIYQHKIAYDYNSTNNVRNLVEYQEEVKSDSIHLVLYSGNKKISSFDVSGHEYNFEVATKEASYTLHRVDHQGNGGGWKEHTFHNNHFHFLQNNYFHFLHFLHNNHFHLHHHVGHRENQENCQEVINIFTNIFGIRVDTHRVYLCAPR